METALYIATNVATLLAVAYAAVRGGSPERLCAAIIAGESVIDLALHLAIGDRTFSQFDWSRFLLDVVSASLFIAVALRANRIYPLTIAASQIVAVIGSVAVVLATAGWTRAFWALTQMPLYLQLALLAGGTYAHRRRVARVGAYNCWSPRPHSSLQLG